MRRIPEKLPGRKAATVLTAIYAAVWISLEGAPWRAILLGSAVTALLVAYAVQKVAGGRRLSWRQLALLLAIAGLGLGVGSGALTLAFMGIKTGLHAHGPEFTPEELAWVLRQTPVWALSGFCGGLGAGLVVASERKPEP